MNSINKIGQQVVCIHQFVAGCGGVKSLPKLHQIYTVTGFEDMKSLDPNITLPAIHLKEIESFYCACVDQKLPWPISGFAPVTLIGKKVSFTMGADPDSENFDNRKRKTTRKREVENV